MKIDAVQSRLRLAALAALALLACGRKEEAPPDSFIPEKVDKGGARDRVGRIYHYVRSNVDGSNPEDVYVFRKRIDHIEVYKARQKCLNAAFVTADLDVKGGYATEIVGGRLTPQGLQEKFAWLNYDAKTKEIAARIEIEGEEPLRDSVVVEKEPWHLYDFDLASLTVLAPHIADPRAGFSFGLPLAIADPGRTDFLLYLGEAEAIFREEEERLGRPALKFSLGGPAFGSFGGNLWIDAAEGHIVDVETGFPNHLDYADFKLELRDINDEGETEWARLLRKHYEGCS